MVSLVLMLLFNNTIYIVSRIYMYMSDHHASLYLTYHLSYTSS